MLTMHSSSATVKIINIIKYLNRVLQYQCGTTKKSTGPSFENENFLGKQLAFVRFLQLIKGLKKVEISTFGSGPPPLEVEKNEVIFL